MHNSPETQVLPAEQKDTNMQPQEVFSEDKTLNDNLGVSRQDLQTDVANQTPDFKKELNEAWEKETGENLKELAKELRLSPEDTEELSELTGKFKKLIDSVEGVKEFKIVQKTLRLTNELIEKLRISLRDGTITFRDATKKIKLLKRVTEFSDLAIDRLNRDKTVLETVNEGLDIVFEILGI